MSHIHRTNHKIASRSALFNVGRILLIAASVTANSMTTLVPTTPRISRRGDSLAEYPGTSASIG